MEQEAMAQRDVVVDVENIGGIDTSTVEFSPGITVLAGHNATNRTSLLQAIIAALGGDSASVKADADQGHVELTIGDSTYTRTLTQANGPVVTEGDPYLDDPTLAELFAFLLESNDARQAVAGSGDLRDVIMRPVDTDEIEDQISRLRSERDRLDEQIEEIETLKQRLPELETEKTELQEDIEERETELSEVETKIESAEADVEEKKESQREIEEKLEALNERRSKLNEVRRKIDSQTESLKALRSELEELEAESEEYDEVPDERIEGIQAEVQRLRSQKNQLESSIDELQTVIQFNTDLLDGNLDIFADLNDGDEEPISNRLLEESDDIVCWTCGNDVDTDQVESMVDMLQSLRNSKMDQRNDLEEEINELNDERRRLKEKRRQRNQIQTRIETIREEISDREARLEDLEDREGDVAQVIEELEAEVETLQEETQQDSELLDHHKEANRLSVEIDRLEGDLEDVEADIERIETRLSEQDELERQRDEVQSEIEELRTRVSRLEDDAVTQFNEHMEEVLEILGYENLERIWIERTEEEVKRGRRNVSEDRFELHVVRSTDSGRVYEDVIDHLSESEREVTGLVFALAGYLVHDVYEEVPFMLLDSMEAIDAPRLASLVEYFEEYVDYLVVALLEEDAEALPDDHERISEI